MWIDLPETKTEMTSGLLYAVVKYISPAEMPRFVTFEIIREVRMSQQSPGRAPTCLMSF